MQKRWIVKEGKQWVKEGIINEEQLKRILNKYPEERKGNSLPFFASLLVGLGILTFVASNWQEIPHLLRLLFIVGAMVGFYYFGYRMVQNGRQRLGEGLVGLGVLSFGAGIFLIGQMFHLTAYHAGSFVFWSIAALWMVFLMRGSYLYYLTLIIPLAGQVYSTVSFQSFNHFLALIFVFGAGYLTYKRHRTMDGTLFSLGVILMGLMYILLHEHSYLWLPPFILTIYILGYLLKNGLRLSVGLAAIFSIVVVNILNVFILQNRFIERSELFPDIFSHSIVTLFLLIIALVLAKRSHEPGLLVPLILFIPWFWIGDFADFIYLIVLFVYSIYLLGQGYKNNEKDVVLQGTILFLVNTFVGYVHLAWAFMSKSMFFLTGGILLFILSWYLEKRRRHWFIEGSGDQS